MIVRLRGEEEKTVGGKPQMQQRKGELSPKNIE